MGIPGEESDSSEGNDSSEENGVSQSAIEQQYEEMLFKKTDS